MRNKTPRGDLPETFKMKVLVFALASSSLLSPTPAAAAENEKALQLRPKEAILTSSAAMTVHQYAPFVSPLGGPELDLVPRREERASTSRSSCEGESSVCYDPGSGHVVYKPARQLMPDLPGLRPENISVKRDRIVFRYSF